jgi:CubicO group peptidase (beta-lactamase class C family)
MRAQRVCALVLALVAAAAVGCTGDTDEATPASGTGPPAREYWPTDGWRTDDPAKHGFDPEELAGLDQLMTASVTPRSVVIVRGGYLVYERYGAGLDATSGHDVRSVTKSVVSALVGIALGDGAIENPDATIGELLPDQLPADADPRMAGVTVTQLLSMTSGLAGDDGDVGGDERIFDAMLASPDWVRHILGGPLAADPGTQWAYSSAGSHLLSAVVAVATGGSTLQFARDRLFGPLGISAEEVLEPVLRGPPDAALYEQFLQWGVAWAVDPQGYHVGGLGLLLPARDLAKIGFLYLNEGRWDDEQIVPADFVHASTTSAAGVPRGHHGDYGWQWWLDADGDHPAFFARGYGGQTIYVVPDLDLVTVVTNDPERPGTDGASVARSIVVPAAED